MKKKKRKAKRKRSKCIKGPTHNQIIKWRHSFKTSVGFPIPQADFAFLVGLPYRTYQDLEYDTHKPDAGTRSLLAHLMDCQKFSEKVKEYIELNF